jgi:gliding motility-associated-like protein
MTIGIFFFYEMIQLLKWIFDRYGKLLKEITIIIVEVVERLHHRPMPSDDYYEVEYTEQDVLKKYRSHFHLKDKKSFSPEKLFRFYTSY